MLPEEKLSLLNAFLMNGDCGIEAFVFEHLSVIICMRVGARARFAFARARSRNFSRTMSSNDPESNKRKHLDTRVLVLSTDLQE